MAAAVLLQAGFVYALVSGLAATMIQKLPDVLKVDVEREKIIPKPPPPPPPQVDIPPPPVAPPPEINIQVDQAPTNTITVSNKPPPAVAPPPAAPVLATRPTPRGSRRGCQDLYPAIAQRLNEEGTTQVHFTITKDGDVINPSIAQSSGSQHLDDATLSCIVRWHWNAAKNAAGEAIETQTALNIKWNLKGQ